MALPQDPTSSFLWGEGGAALTPEQIAQLRAIQMRGKGGIDTSPVGHWTQGAARIVDALGDVIQGQRLNKAEASNNDYNKTLLQTIMGGDESASAIPSPGASAQVNAGNPSAAPDVSGLSNSDIYKGFIDTVKGSVANPYGLAAVAATGKAESGYDPAKINASWADPSESGVQGTSGGLMSWRNERLANLRNFAQANGEDPKNISPQMQAKFFLQEDPNLIAGLNNAKSVEEAQGLMNNAWKFAGYNRSGGEAGRRLATAQALLSSFQGQPQKVASSGYVDPQVTTAGRVEQASLPPVDPMAAQAAPQQGPQLPPQMAQPPIQAVPDPALATAPAAPQVSPQSQQVAQAILSQPQPQQAPQAPQTNKRLLAILADPRANEGTKRLASAMMQQQQARAQALYEQQLKQSDPRYQTGLQLDQLNIQEKLNPPDPDQVRSLDARAKRAGLQPGTPQYNDFMITGGNKAPAQVGTPPAGYKIDYDPTGNPVSMSVIPGGPADTSKKDNLAAESRANSTDVITTAADRARQALHAPGMPATGMMGAVAALSPESNAAEVRRQMKVLTSNATIENLNAMRQQSPTGGALGNVTEGEGAMLSAKAGALDPNSPNFERDLNDYERSLLRIVHGNKNGDEIWLSGNSQRFPNAPKIGAVDQGHRYIGGDPSQPDSWEAVK